VAFLANVSDERRRTAIGEPAVGVDLGRVSVPALSVHADERNPGPLSLACSADRLYLWPRGLDVLANSGVSFDREKVQTP
jgi:hypothetical protein